MSSANMVLAKVSVSLDKADAIPEPQQEQGKYQLIVLPQLLTLPFFNHKKKLK
jgi:hypothetical protein